MINQVNRFADIFQNHRRRINDRVNNGEAIEHIQLFFVRPNENMNGFQNYYLANRFAPPTVGGEIAAVYDPLVGNEIRVCLNLFHFFLDSNIYILKIKKVCCSSSK